MLQDNDEANRTETEESAEPNPVATAPPAQHQSLPAQIVRLFGHAGLRRILATHGQGNARFTVNLDGGENDEEEGIGSQRRRRTKTWKNKFPPIPSMEGKKLMDGGLFGNCEYYKDKRIKRGTMLARKLMSREIGSQRIEATRCTGALSQVCQIRKP